MLGGVVEGLLKAMPAIRPEPCASSPWPTSTCAGGAMTWPGAWMNDPPPGNVREGLVPAPASSKSGITMDGRRMLEAIDNLPEDEREVFGLVRLSGVDAGWRTVDRWIPKVQILQPYPNVRFIATHPR